MPQKAHKTDLIRLYLTPDELREIAEALEHREKVLKLGDSTLAYLIEAPGLEIQFRVKQ